MLWLYISLIAIAVFVIVSFAIVALMFQGALGRKSKNDKSSVDTASLMPAFAPFREQIKRDREWYYAQHQLS